MLHEPLVALLVILCLVFPLGIALFAFGWGLRSYRGRYELENALAEARLRQDREPGVAKTSEDAPPRAEAKQATTQPALKTATASARKAPATDDLTRINGIGPVMSRSLNEAGIHSFAQIAAWKEADIAAFGDLISSPGRIHNDDWIGQARKLAREQSS